MISLPAAAWRGGRWYRGIVTGVPIGLFFGALAWLDSGMVLSGAIVTTVLGVAFGVVMSRRMRRYWPGANELDPADRVAVVHAVRQGEAVPQPRLASAAVEYQRGLHAAHVDIGALRLKWAIGVLLVVAAAMAVYDALSGSVRDTVASLVYLALLVFEVSVWPKVRDRLLHNADQSVELSSR